MSESVMNALPVLLLLPSLLLLLVGLLVRSACR
jgi:hypothetical protein